MSADPVRMPLRVADRPIWTLERTESGLASAEALASVGLQAL